MDKFDARLSKARDTYEPSEGFVDRTMDEVKKHKIHRRFSLKIWAPAVAGALGVLVVAVILVPKPAQNNVIDSSKLLAGSHKDAKNAPSTSPAPIADGTDNASLDRDLSGVQGSMNQSGGEQSSVDSSVNDNQQEISVPTN